MFWLHIITPAFWTFSWKRKFKCGSPLQPAPSTCGFHLSLVGLTWFFKPCSSLQERLKVSSSVHSHWNCFIFHPMLLMYFSPHYMFVNQMAWWHSPVAFLHLWNLLMNLSSGGGLVRGISYWNSWLMQCLTDWWYSWRLKSITCFRPHSGYREGSQCTLPAVAGLQRFSCQGSTIILQL